MPRLPVFVTCLLGCLAMPAPARTAPPPSVVYPRPQVLYQPAGPAPLGYDPLQYLLRQQRDAALLQAKYARNLELIRRYPFLAGHLDLPPQPCGTSVLPAVASPSRASGPAVPPGR